MSSTVEQSVSELSIPVPWGEIRGKCWGPDHGYPVLCLHGWLDNCGTFKTLIPLLPKECRYVAVDLAGHGLSSHLPLGVLYGVTTHMVHVRRIVEGLGCISVTVMCSGLQWKKFSIMGHSMGGNIAGMENLSKVMRQGMDEMLQHEKKTEEKKRVYTYEKAVERLSAASPTLSEQSVHILLERGLVQVEGGFVFSRDLRVNFKNITRISLEQSLEMQSKIQAFVLVVLGDKGFAATFPESNQQLPSSKLLKAYRDRNHTVVTVSGDHHVHLNDPEAVAPLVSDFLRDKVLSQQLPA